MSKYGKQYFEEKKILGNCTVLFHAVLRVRNFSMETLI
jgi:hypothetical protein